MAVLMSLDNKNNIRLTINGYEQKNEFWFSATVIFIQDKNVFIRGTGCFHLNDFVRLITGVKSFFGNNTFRYFTFDPIEPYFNIKITKSNGAFSVSAFFNQGPVFEASGYKKIAFITSKENLIKFLEEIESNIKEVDSELKLKEIPF